MLDLLITLQEAARAYGRLVNPGAIAAEVRIRFHDGSKASLPVPIMATTPVPAKVYAPTLPESGWSFFNNRPFYDGKPIDITGQKLRLLRVIAEAEGPLSVDDLRAKAWRDSRTEEVTIRWSVGELRKELRKLFDFEDDPIPNGPDGYTLALK